MRKLIFLPLVLALCMIMIGCEKDDVLLQSSLLNMRWIESYEEKTAEEIEIYRPGDHEDFPPSWYRQVFYFDDNKVCEYSVLAATDAHFMARGSWEYKEKNKNP